MVVGGETAGEIKTGSSWSVDGKIQDVKRPLSYNEVVEEAFCSGWGEGLQ